MSGDQELQENLEQATHDKKIEKYDNVEADPGQLEAQSDGEESAIDSEQEGSLSIESLTRELELAKQKAQESWDRLVRTQAEMENLRRRTEKDLQNAHKFGLENIIKELLPVVDSLELGIHSVAGDNPEVTKLREGSELTLKQLLSVFEKFNCTVIDPMGDDFNPQIHQAMSMRKTVDSTPNTIVEVFQKGYLLNDRLVRPAMVVVAQAETTTKIDEQA